MVQLAVKPRLSSRINRFWGEVVFSTDRIRLIRSKWDGGLSARVSMNATASSVFLFFSLLLFAF